MNWFFAACRHCISKLWLIGVVLLVITAISFSLLRASLPYLNEYRDNLSAWLYQHHQIDLQFKRIDGHWRGVGPVITLEHLALKPSPMLPASVFVAEAQLQLDLRSSLLAMAPRFRQVSINKLMVRAEVTQDDQPSLDIGQVLELLFAQFREVTVTDAQLVLVKGELASPVIPIRELSFISDAERRQLSALVGKRSSLKAPLQLVLDLFGDPREDLRGRLYTKAESFRLVDWLKPLLPDDNRLQRALLNFEFWGEFSAMQLDSAMLRLGQIRLDWPGPDDGNQLAINGGLLQWLPVSDGWQLHTVDLDMATNDHRWPGAGLSIRQQGDRLAGTLAPLKLELLTPLLTLLPQLDDSQLATVGQLALSGELRNGQWHYQDGDWGYQAVLDGLAWQQVGAIPKVSGLGARLQGTQNSGQLNLSLDQQPLDFGEHFRAPIAVEQLRGHLQWQVDAAQWRVEGRELQIRTADLSTNLAFTLSDEADSAPVLALYGELALKDAARAGDYFPVTAMGQPLADYLNGALKKGHINLGQVLWQGPLDAFPYEDNSGIFQVDAIVEQTEFLFDETWPPLEESRLKLQFEDAAMLITGLDGHLQGQRFELLTAEIPYLGEGAELFIDFNVNTLPAKVSEIMAASPLADSVGAALEDLTVTGPVEGKVNLHIPLTEGEARARGTVNFADNGLTIDALKLSLDGLNGQLQFDNDRLTASGLQLQWYEQPLEVALRGQDSNDFYGLEIDLLAKWHSDKIPEAWKTHLDAYASGTLDWQGKLLLKIEPEDVEYQANFRSPMKGLALKLPKPLNKYIAQEEELTLSVTGDSHKGQVNAGFGARAEMLTQYQLADNALDITAVDLLVGRRFASKDPLSAKDTTLRVELEELALDQWQQFVTNLEEQDPGESLLPPLKRIEAVVKRLKLYGQVLEDAQVQAQRQEDAWVIDIRSAQVAGQIKEYHQEAGGALEADFSRFALTMGESEALAGLSQAELQALPPMTFHCDSCTLGGIEIGAVDFVTQPSDDGIEVVSLTAKTKDTLLSLAGRWGFNDSGEYSEVKGHMESEDFDETVRGFNYASHIRDSDARMDFDLGWQGSPYQPAMETMAGEINWRLGEGHLAEVSDKGARIFSLFSLDSLRRKLVLDFRDVFQKGVFYNKFKGSFQIEKGVAITDDTYMDGVAGTLNVTGSYNLTNENLDYLLVFSPRLFSNLPVVAGVMTSTPTVFLLTFAITKVLEPMIEVVSQVRFRLTGTVDEPKFVELERKRRSFKVPEEMLPQDSATKAATSAAETLVLTPETSIKP